MRPPTTASSKETSRIVEESDSRGVEESGNQIVGWPCIQVTAVEGAGKRMVSNSEFLGVTAARGFRAAGVACGLKANGAPDFALVASDTDCSCAGVFTTNRVKAAPVLYDQEVLARNPEKIRAIAINSGCANACTGERGLQDARNTANMAANLLGCRVDQVLVLSTGVIGQPLKMDKLKNGITLAASHLAKEGGADAARAIMTTDTRPKTFDLRFPEYSIGGMCKGAGMIHPNMATMLAVVTTDAAVAPPLLARALHVSVEKSFNRITIDGDMSTNDSLLVLANGSSGFEVSQEHDLALFASRLTELTTHLAKEIVRDGEGATKFVEIQVTGAHDEAEAAQVAQAIGNSPLVKTALYGGDANWGRVLAAAGYSGAPVEPDRMALWFGNVQLVAHGEPTQFDEAESTRAISGNEVQIHLDLGLGNANATVWTCDLSHDYVTINGKYRT